MFLTGLFKERLSRSVASFNLQLVRSDGEEQDHIYYFIRYVLRQNVILVSYAAHDESIRCQLVLKWRC